MNRLTKWCESLQEWQENHDNDERKGFKNGSRACMTKLAEYEDLESRLQSEYSSDEINLNLLVEHFIKAIEKHDLEPFKGYRILTNKDALLYDKWKESL